MRCLSRLSFLILTALLTISTFPLEATEPESSRMYFAEGGAEIPAFARKYKFSCSVCHAPIPRLTEFGDVFAGNGFQIAVEEEPRDTICLLYTSPSPRDL